MKHHNSQSPKSLKNLAEKHFKYIQRKKNAIILTIVTKSTCNWVVCSSVTLTTATNFST